MARKKASKAIGWAAAMRKCKASARKNHPGWSAERIERYCAGGLRRTGQIKYGKAGFKARQKAGRRK